MNNTLIISLAIVVIGLSSFIPPGGPIGEYKVGAAKITVWENKREDGSTWKNFEVEKFYKKGDNWESSNTFDERELLQLKEALEQAIEGQGVMEED